MAAEHRGTFLIATLVVVGLGTAAAVDATRQPYTGHLADAGHTVIAVFPDSPADAAGMRAGDEILRVDGIVTGDPEALARAPRARVGETRAYDIRRQGETRTLMVTAGGRPAREITAARMATLLGSLFVAIGVWSYLAAPAHVSAVFASMGLCLGLGFLGAPYLPWAMARALMGTTATAVVLVGLAALLHFLALFPEPRPFVARSGGARRIYLPAFVAIALLFARHFIPPGSSVHLGLRALFNVLLGGYFLAALALLLRRFAAATPTYRRAHGLGLMLFGAIIGLSPLLVVAVAGLAAPSAWLPLSDYYFLALGAIPITFGAALRRSGDTHR